MLDVNVLIHYLTSLVDRDNLKGQSRNQEKKRNEMNYKSTKRERKTQWKYEVRRRKWIKKCREK
jgi:hypothetical protein